MWTCKFCKKTFDFLTTSEKANHSRWCEKNPKRNLWKKAQPSITRFGEIKQFIVECSNCGESVTVKEREKLFPTKKQYYCSRVCANSVGGKAKRNKYGIIGYETIAAMFYKKQCAVCGVTDILDIHHIDENRNNFHPSNLIYLCPNDHYRLHRNKDESVKEVIKGHGTAWGGHFTCNEEFSGVQTPDAPPDYFLKDLPF